MTNTERLLALIFIILVVLALNVWADRVVKLEQRVATWQTVSENNLGTLGKCIGISEALTDYTVGLSKQVEVRDRAMFRLDSVLKKSRHEIIGLQEQYKANKNRIERIEKRISFWETYLGDVPPVELHEYGN